MPRKEHENCEVVLKPMLQLLNYRTFTVGCVHKDVAMVTHNPKDGICYISLFLNGQTVVVECHSDGRISLDLTAHDDGL